MTRKQLRKRMYENIEKIAHLHKENNDIKKQMMLLTDKEQQFSEKKEVHGKGKNKKEYLVGRIQWKEDFVDEDTDEVITIERSAIVRVDGEWKDGIY